MQEPKPTLSDLPDELILMIMHHGTRKDWVKVINALLIGYVVHLESLSEEKRLFNVLGNEFIRLNKLKPPQVSMNLLFDPFDGDVYAQDISETYYITQKLDLKNQIIKEVYDKTYLSISVLTMQPSYDDFSCYFMSNKGAIVYGKNQRGLLGLGHNNQPQRPTALTLDDKPIKKIIFGETTTFFKTDTGWYGAGANDHGQILSSKKDHEPSPVHFEIPEENIIDIQSTRQTTLYHCDSGAVYGCSHNSDGQLGLSPTKSMTTAYKLLLPEKASAIYNGNTTVFTFSKEGRCYVSGNNLFNSTGLDTDSEPITSFTEIKLQKQPVPKITSVTRRGATFFHSEDKSIFCTGIDSLALSEESTTRLISNISIKDEVIVKLEASNTSVLVLTQSGHCYGFGWNSKGQLGIGDDKKATEFQRVQLIDQNIVHFELGQFNSYFLTKNNEVFACGLGTSGQLGKKLEESLEFISTPIKVQIDNNPPICKIFFNEVHQMAFFVSQAGQVYCCGGGLYFEPTKVSDTPEYCLETLNKLIEEGPTLPSQSTCVLL